jgi:hypothetical protein
LVRSDERRIIPTRRFDWSLAANYVLNDDALGRSNRGRVVFNGRTPEFVVVEWNITFGFVVGVFLRRIGVFQETCNLVHELCFHVVTDSFPADNGGIGRNGPELWAPLRRIDVVSSVFIAKIIDVMRIQVDSLFSCEWEKRMQQ